MESRSLFVSLISYAVMQVRWPWICQVRWIGSEVEVCMGVGLPMGMGISWDSHGNGNKILFLMGMGVGIRKAGMAMIRFLHSHHFEFPAFLQRLLCALKESPIAVLVSVVCSVLPGEFWRNAGHLCRPAV